jgi:hypothetical protein
MAIEEELRLAVRIYRHIPGAGSIVFSAHDAMEWAGISAVVAADPWCFYVHVRRFLVY